MNSKVFIVTGASRGLGEAITREFSRLGCRVLAAARDAGTLETLWEHDPNVHWTAADLSYQDQVESVVRETVERFGRLDGLVNNAGVIQPIEPLHQCDPAEWAKAVQINLVAPAMLTAAALPHLRESRGRVVNISSGAAVKPMQGWSAYCASKAGLLHLAAVAAEEYPEVGFFSLRPGVIDTGMQKEIRASSGMSESDLARFRGLKESGGLEPPEVPAGAAVWLALHGPLERSGEFIQYTDEQIQAGIKELNSGAPSRD